MKKIIVVDDDQAILTVVSEALNSSYEVFTSENVFDAENIIRENNIDLLITDLVMPEKNGIDMIMDIKKNNPEIVILAISGGGGITGRFDYLPIAKLVGAAETLQKPFTMTELRNAVERLLS